MNIVNKLTIRHLRQNKRRTLVTMIGVIISVAMITAVATISVSFMDLFQRQTIADEGEWHVQYYAVNPEQIKGLQEDEETEAVVLTRDIGYAQLEGNQNPYKPYVFVREYNQAGFAYFPIALSEGRLPQKASEIVLSEEIAETAKVRIELGDTLTLDIGQRVSLEEASTERSPLAQYDGLLTTDGQLAEEIGEVESRSYTVVGYIKRPVWEPTWAPGYTVISYVDEHLLGAEERVNGYVVLDKVKKSLYGHAEQVAEEIGLTSDMLRYNNGLLRYYGITNNDALNNTLVSLSAIMMSIIMVGSISLIYNAFAISVSERSRHLGMLSSVGATRRQKRNSVFFEGAVIGLISIPLGILGGFIGIGITFYFINSAIMGALGVTESLTVTVSLPAILIACGVSILTIFISTYIPARRASRISAIDAIRQSTDIKLTGKAVKTSRLVRRLFGIEAELGLKNLKRNKRRYQATVFSLVISILLFLTVSYFTDMLKLTTEMSQDGLNYDIRISVDPEKADPQLLEKITALEEVTAYNKIDVVYLDTWIEEEKLANSLVKLLKEDPNMQAAGTYVDGNYRFRVELYGVDAQGLKDYADTTGVDYARIMAADQLNAIVVNEFDYQDKLASKFIKTEVLQTDVGDQLSFFAKDFRTGAETQLANVTPVAFTDQLPIGIASYTLGSIKVIVSEDVLDQLLSEEMMDGLNHTTTLNLTSRDPMKTQRDIEEMEGMGSSSIRNLYKSKQQEEQLILLISVFTYGFIILITAISAANILNTITTSISLRKREFAMLKSVGMTPKGFSKMINYESIFYGMKSLLYGLPISVAVMLLIHRSVADTFEFSFQLPWLSILIVIVAVFAIVGLSMMYSSSKVKRENIIDAIKQESV